MSSTEIQRLFHFASDGTVWYLQTASTYEFLTLIMEMILLSSLTKSLLKKFYGLSVYKNIRLVHFHQFKNELFETFFDFQNESLLVSIGEDSYAAFIRSRNFLQAANCCTFIMAFIEQSSKIKC